MDIIRIKIYPMTGRTGRAVPNQYEIQTSDGDTYFQSYMAIIALNRGGQIYLDSTYWNYSTITGRYRNQFLGETKQETERKIKDGTYKLVDLN